MPTGAAVALSSKSVAPARAMSNNQFRPTWIKIVEAKDLKAVDSNGLSDPYVSLTNPGVSTRKGGLATPVVKKNLNPKWRTEFVIASEPRIDSLLLRVLDWNLFGGAELIGHVRLGLELEPMVLHDLWLPLDTQGSIRVLVFCQQDSSNRSTKTAKLPPLRLQLEREAYYPGEAVRGAVVLNLAKAAKKHKLSISIKSFTHTHSSSYVKSTLKSYEKDYYFLDAEVKNITIPGGTPRGGALPPGFHVVPFQIQLPLALPPTMRSKGYNYGITSLVVDTVCDIDGEEIRDYIYLELLPLIGHTPPSTAPIRAPSTDIERLHDPENPTKSTYAVATVEGPSHILAGQTVPLRCRITNWSHYPVEFFKVVLKQTSQSYVHQEKDGPLRLASGDSLSHTLPFVDEPYSNWTQPSDVPQFPLSEKGASWEGTVSVKVPDDIEPSVPFTTSPLLKRAYCFQLQLYRRGNTEYSNSTQMELISSSSDDDTVEVFNCTAPSPPAPQKPMEIISDNQPGTIGPIYCYLEPFSEAELAKFELLLLPRFSGGVAKFMGCDLGFLFERDTQPSPTARNMSSVKKSATNRLVTPELWTPGNMPSWAH